MAKGQNSGLNLEAMFANAKPITTPAEQLAPEVGIKKANNDNNLNNVNKNNNVNNDNNIDIKNNLNKTNKKNTGNTKRGRPPKSEPTESERVNRTFIVDLDLWQEVQQLARIFNMPVSEYIEELMRAAVKKNAEILESVRNFKR